jgi:hypothetical protein
VEFFWVAVVAIDGNVGFVGGLYRNWGFFLEVI